MRLPHYLNQKRLRPAIGFLMHNYALLEGGPLFSDLVLKRDRELWIEPDKSIHAPNVCRNELVAADQDLETWHCCSLWQRKLNNKLNAKIFAAKHGMRVAELYWCGKDPAEIPFDRLPSRYAVKTSTGWSAKQVLPMIDGVNVFTNKPIAPEIVRDRFRVIMASEPYASGYVLVEELLKPDSDAPIPKDYKCWLFGGTVHFIQVVNRIELKHRWYDRDWRPISDQMHLGADLDVVDARPSNISELIYWAELLARNYEYTFVRIDLYDTAQGVVFGEFTPTPMAGPSRLLYTPYANRTMGGLWSKGHDHRLEGIGEKNG